MGLAGGVAVAVAGLKPWRALIEITAPPLPGRLAALLGHRRSAGVVGREYLRVADAERTAEELLDRLVAGLPGGREAVEPASRSELHELVVAAIDRDFADERTVRLRGWIVSRTEARLCALVATRRSNGPFHRRV